MGMKAQAEKEKRKRQVPKRRLTEEELNEASELEEELEEDLRAEESSTEENRTDESGDDTDDGSGESIRTAYSSQVDEGKEILGVYLRRIAQNEILTAEQEHDLAVRSKNGDKDAARTLVEHNLRLVVSIAKRYVGTESMTLMDLIQEGNIGLMRAVRSYDPDYGCRFTTYAVWWIRQAVTRAAAEQDKLERIPVHMIEAMNQYRKTKERLSLELGREPSREELDEALGKGPGYSKRLDSYSCKFVSLDQPVRRNSEEESDDFSSFIPDENAQSPEEHAEKEALKELLDRMLSDLTEREQYVIRRRFGMDGKGGCTLEELGQEVGVTRERIRQIEGRAVRKLRHPKYQKMLDGYLHENVEYVHPAECGPYFGKRMSAEKRNTRNKKTAQCLQEQG